jgi:hypothetical protein
VPGEVLPEIHLLLGVARALGELVDQLRRQLGDRLVEGREIDHRALLESLLDLGGPGRMEPLARPRAHRRDDPVDEAPVEALLRVDLLAQEQDLPGAAIADRDWQPLGGAARRHAADFRPHLADVGVLGHHREVARQVELVAAARHDAVDAGDDRLADVAQQIVAGGEDPHPIPVVARPAGVLGRVFLHVAPGAEGLVAGAGQDNDGHAVVPRGVLEGAGHLAQGVGRVGVVEGGPVDGDRRDPVLLRVRDVLEAEGLGGLGLEGTHVASLRSRCVTSERVVRGRTCRNHAPGVGGRH